MLRQYTPRAPSFQERLMGKGETGDWSMREVPAGETGPGATGSEGRRRDGVRDVVRGEVGFGHRSPAPSLARTVGRPITWERQLFPLAAGEASGPQPEWMAVDCGEGRREGRMGLTSAHGSSRTSYAWARRHDSPCWRAIWWARVHGVRRMALEMAETSGRGLPCGPG